MKKLPESAIEKEFGQAGRQGPIAISTVCAGCNEKVLFSLGNHHYGKERDTFSSTAACPSCGAKTHFWTLGPKNPVTKNALYQAPVFMHPTLLDYHEAVHFGNYVPEALARSYHSTVDSGHQVKSSI